MTGPCLDDVNKVPNVPLHDLDRIHCLVAVFRRLASGLTNCTEEESVLFRNRPSLARGCLSCVLETSDATLSSYRSVRTRRWSLRLSLC
jgi:hypothetical protein